MLLHCMLIKVRLYGLAWHGSQLFVIISIVGRKQIKCSHSASRFACCRAGLIQGAFVFLMGNTNF